MIAIYEDQGGEYDPDDYEPTALYDGDNWVAGGEKWEEYYPAGTPESEIAVQLTGPSAVAVDVDDADAILEEIEKAFSDTRSPGEAEMDVVTDRENDSEGDEQYEPPWAKTYAKRSGVGPPQATLLGVGDEVTETEAEPSDEMEEAHEKE